VLGIRYEFVSIVPFKELLGRIAIRRYRTNARVPRILIKKAILHSLAGGLAESLMRRDGQASGLARDLEIAVKLIKVLFKCRSSNLVVFHSARMHARADALVCRHWLAIRRVAAMLLEEKTVSEAAVLRILRRGNHYGDWWRCPCPAHRSTSESLSIRDGGRFDIIARLFSRDQCRARHGFGLIRSAREAFDEIDPANIVPVQFGHSP
jgi:hypothetical protein